MKTLVNGDGQHVVHFEFDNGYTLSLVKRWAEDVCNVSAAYWPTADKSAASTKLVGSELSDDAVAKLFAEVSGLCGDEGCPQHGTVHVCVSSTTPNPVNGLPQTPDQVRGERDLLLISQSALLAKVERLTKLAKSRLARIKQLTT